MTAQQFGELLLTWPGLDRDEFDGALIGQSLDNPVLFTVELESGETFQLVISKA